MKTNRRQFLGLSAGAAGMATLPLSAGSASAEAVKTNARIVIIGAGAAGAALSNRLVRRLDGAKITLVDPRKEHLYQPGLTLVATGLKPANYVVSETTDWLPKEAELVAEAATEIDPVGRKVRTSGGKTLEYDYLVVAPGLVLDYDAIEGFSPDLIGKDGIGALYANPDFAARTWEAAGRFTEEGGVGIFTRPATEMKCAGAPLKHTFLIDDIAKRKGNGGKIEITYANNNDALFGVPIVAEKVRMLFGDRGIAPALSHVLKRIEPGQKIATFATPEGDKEMGYDYLHVIPPQRAPDVVRQSGLSWADKWVDQGWVEVDQKTLRHRRFPEVFAVGDVAGVPKGKTAASAKWQVPVVEEHLVASIANDTADAEYTGYTSCPMITKIGRAMLVEFDYNNNLTPSFPGIIAPLEELWISWLMKELALKPTYNAMLRGEA